MKHRNWSYAEILAFSEWRVALNVELDRLYGKVWQDFPIVWMDKFEAGLEPIEAASSKEAMFTGMGKIK